jgi:hypothetical protein
MKGLTPEDFVTIDAKSNEDVIDELLWRWNTLKNVIITMSAKTELISDEDPYYTCDQRWGFDEALSRVENIIEKLEKL